MVSLMAALTSAMAFIPRFVTRRASTRNPDASPKTMGRKMNSMRDICRLVRRRTAARISACTICEATSVTMTTN
jgi:hypothetical protein